MEEFRSRVYTDRPPYADFPAPQKFEAIKIIIARRLREHPKAICSYSGGSDSDIMIDLIEQVRKIYSLPSVDYCFFNTGLEMDATKRHVRETAQKYGVEIREYRPKKNIVQATREYGQPFVSKIMSQGLSGVQRKGIPLSIADEYANAEDKAAKRQELRERFPKCESEINFFVLLQFGGRAATEHTDCNQQQQVHARLHTRKPDTIQGIQQVLRHLQKARGARGAKWI